ncbi:unnamed protein product [Peronospora belbahrii]|uniref:Nucleolar protein 11 n=1 Tax=Peronospora belbahrii TaxID=622444 RepID=A0AAU9KN82_9STRA|nr:unnamed protein product [Peronospora belbahrii]
MELDQSILLWRGRAADTMLLGATTCMSKEGNRLVLLTSAEDVREICVSTRKCINHWTFRAGSAHALHVAAARHPRSRLFFGVCGVPGVSASKMARQIRRQEANKTTTLPASEGLAVWRDTDLDVATWRRTPLQSNCKVFSLLTHVKLKEEVVVVFQDGSFATYDEDLNRGVHSDDAKEAVAVEDDEDGDEKTTQKGDKQLELLVYQITCPNVTRRMGGVLSVVLLVRRRVVLPDNEELSSCAFHPETFSYSLIGRSGCWQTLRFSRDALTNAVTLVASYQMPNLASAEVDSAISVHKKRKLQAASKTGSGYMVSGIGHVTYLVSLSLDAPLKITAWDSKFAVPVSKTEISLMTEKDNESNSVIGRSSKDGVGKPVQIVNVGPGDVVFVIYERGAFLIHVRNKNSTLASVLGATACKELAAFQRLTTPAMPDSAVEWDSVTSTSSVNNDTLDAETWKANICSDDDRECQLIADLLNPKVTSTAAEFINRLDKALAKQQSEQKAGKKQEEELSYRLLQAVTRRCLDSTDLGLWAPLEQMLRTKRLSARAEPTLLPTLMKHNQFALLECAIVHLIDIDERSIVHLLKYFIRKSSNSSFIKFVAKQVKVQDRNTGKIDEIAACERFIVALLGLPTNTVFLHRAIRELELEEVLLVLAICKKLLLVHTIGDDAEDEEEATKSSKKSKTSKKKRTDNIFAVMKDERRFTPLPSASHCCAWICALLDAHLLALVQRASQNSEVSCTLHQLDDLVQLLLRTNAQYESVHGVLSNFLSGVRLPQAPGLSDYSIEELRL